MSECESTHSLPQMMFNDAQSRKCMRSAFQKRSQKLFLVQRQRYSVSKVASMCRPAKP